MPEELSVAGFDDVAYAKLSRPALTTVRQNVGEKARRSVEALIRKINGETVGGEYRISTFLVERKSVSGRKTTEERS